MTSNNNGHKQNRKEANTNSNSNTSSDAMELQDLSRKRSSRQQQQQHQHQPSAHTSRNRRQQQQQGSSPAIDLPLIDTSVRRANMGGSHSMPPSPTLGLLTAQSAPITRYPSNPHTADLFHQRLPLTALPSSANFVQSGKMTKVPHYGRLRSVTTRILRMMDPRTLAQQHQRQHMKMAEERATGVQPEESTSGGTAAGVLGRSVVDTMRDATAVRRRRRFSHGSIPMGALSRHASRESRLAQNSLSVSIPPNFTGAAGPRKSIDFLRKSEDYGRRPSQQLTRPSWLSQLSPRTSRMDPLSLERDQLEGEHLLSPVQSIKHGASGEAFASLLHGNSASIHRTSMDARSALSSNINDKRSIVSIETQDASALPQPVQLMQCAVTTESIIAIPMPGFFLDPASDHWVGGHSFRQRMRYPNEAITVPASLTKRVHYEVSYDYPKNAISTARYNVVTFLPAQIAAQFSKVANIYFLFIAILQQVPGWSTTGRWSTVLPLCVFVSLSIAHEGFDDLRRHRMDHAENAQHTRVLKVKVHDRERLSFNFRELRHRGSHSIHSFRLRSSQSIHDIGRNTVDSAKRWAGSTIRIGSTIKESIVSRIAEKRRKQRELEDSDDEDEHVGANPNVTDGEAENVDGGDGVAESLLRKKLNRGVMSLRSWRGNRDDTQQNTGPNNTGSSQGDSGDDGEGQENNAGSSQQLNELGPMSDMESLRMMRRQIAHRRQASKLGGASLAATSIGGSMLDGQLMSPRRNGPTVAFNDIVEEVSFENLDEEIENPLPENMSCRWKKKRWENVQVGDLIMITKDEWIPADCIVIASTGFDGTCFVETAALDGETTLKQKQALEATNSEIQAPEQLAAFNAFTYVEPPSAELYNFEGYMEIKGERYPLTPNQLLLRGSVLRNTAYVYAQVVYSGEQTRLRLNATRNVRTKAPQIQRITNRIVIFVFFLLLVLCFVFSALGIHWNGSRRKKHWYLHKVHMPATALIFGYIVMMNALIPISLYVTLEAVKIFQCWFIQQDIAMYHPDTDTRAEARTTAINEDLGMVRYVFSDKTGTLTENIMKLRAVMIAGFSYLHIDLDRLKDSPKSGSKDTEEPVVDGLGTLSPESPKVHRTSSRLSFLRSGPLSAGSNGRQSPSLFKAQLFSKHRRQQSLPSPVLGSGAPTQGPRTLQQIAAANRANNGGGNGSSLRLPFAKHVRGLSASILRSPTNSVAAEDDDDSSEDGRAGSTFTEQQNLEMANERAAELAANTESAKLLNECPNSTAEASQLESAVDSEIEADPDLVGAGDEDPRAHTKASDDAPVSDLFSLPSSRRMMDSYTPPSEVFRARAEWFLRCMALCHTVQPDRDPLTGRITGYQATSPDEKALVAAAAELGYVMNNRAGPLVQLRVVASERMRDFNRAVIHGIKSNSGKASEQQQQLDGQIVTGSVSATSTPGTAVFAGLHSEIISPTGTEGTTIEPASAKASSDDGSRPNVNATNGNNCGSGQQKNSESDNPDAQSFDRGVPPPDPTDRLGNYEVLDVLEFSSARKRMSVILRCPDGRIVMMSKGADSALLPRLLKPENMNSDSSDTSYLPRPSRTVGRTSANGGSSNENGLGFASIPLRRKLSQPSAAYLHSRSSSVGSSMDYMRSDTPDLMPMFAGIGGVSPNNSNGNSGNGNGNSNLLSVPFPPRAISRLTDSVLPYSDIGSGNSAAASPRTPSGLCTSFDIRDGDPDEDEDEDDNKRASKQKSTVVTESSNAGNSLAEYGTLPLYIPANSASQRPSGATQFKLAHRRLMSDSQFSAISEVSSFADTQGHVEIPSSFGTPSREEEKWARAQALEALHQFSTEGLRTLMYAHKEIEPDYYEAWHNRYVAATTALVNRQQQVEAICEEIEGDLLLSGVSAIEDRLQAGVPETIFKLRRAGIRVWMLTGDKVETAINIAKSCRLIDTDVVETKTLDLKMMEQNKDRMALLVMQSITDYDNLEQIISQALEVAHSAAASVDERFEKRSKIQKLKRGMKKFGNMLNPRHRARRDQLHRHNKHQQGLRQADDVLAGALQKEQGNAGGTLGLRHISTAWPKPSTKTAEYLETSIADDELQRPATAIGWANDLDGSRAGTATPAPAPTLNNDILEVPRNPANMERAVSQATTVTTTTAAITQGQQCVRMSSSSSSSSQSSDVTRGVSKKNSTSTSDEPASESFGTISGGSRLTAGSPSFAVVIDGETLAALENYASEGLLDKFLSLGTMCDAVICSRVSPSQKALIVHNMRVRCEGGGIKGNKDTEAKMPKTPWYHAQRLLRPVVDLFKHDNDKYMVTLAIGDGGNDIAMIQEAHVGIGIAGQEGLQASRAADFSIGQFRFLQKLLFVHGRWSYVRVSMFIMGTFYKCMAFYVTQLIFQFYTGFSGTSLFESWTLSMYNTLFSILPVLVVGIFEQDLQPETLMAYPELYRDMGPKNHLFSVPLFIKRVVLIGILHSVIAAYFPIASSLYLGHDATTDDQFIVSIVVYGIMVLIVTLKIAYVDVRRWVIFSHLSVILSLVLWFGWNGVLNHIYPSSPGQGYYVLGTFRILMKNGAFWFQWIIFVAIALCLNVLILLAYTLRDPVEHRIATWVAFERRKEHTKHSHQRKLWMQRHRVLGVWDVLTLKWLRSSDGASNKR
ncbi:hypothetical protein GGI26_000189 [Coemansia sp. RSA 1358]|uniref:P-type phospholipid transporter n=1 Tax=Coemansia umbellata TaxID=1424467 RepID=A0ABQ8PV12_9FUNG|nr:hypothetical protein EDC05_000028 [Coemansia umbellata]KAJ2626105.1 hypothetical protein GGI26_000189 [Coemansia sp. RSA 1358]